VTFPAKSQEAETLLCSESLPPSVVVTLMHFLFTLAANGFMAHDGSSSDSSFLRQKMKLTPFHLAIQVRDIAEARDFYGSKLGFSEGRSAASWVDFNMFGHQLVTHLNPALGKNGSVASRSNVVDGHGVPVPHFGVVLEMEDWQALADKARSFVSEFLIEPYVRFRGEAGEQATMFFTDPSGNALEFKAFKNIEEALFAK
jgi:extradiol dioxygenase family protein